MSGWSQRAEGSMILHARSRNLRIVVPCLIVIGIMIELVAYSPTLYRLIFAATGFGGKTQRADSALEAVSNRIITVRFDSNVAPGLPWRFEPVQREEQIHLLGYPLTLSQR